MPLPQPLPLASWPNAAGNEARAPRRGPAARRLGRAMLALGSGLALLGAAPAAFADTVTRYSFSGELSPQGWPWLRGGVLTGTADWNPTSQQWTYWDLNVENPYYQQGSDDRSALLARLSSNALNPSTFGFDQSNGGMELGSNRYQARSADAFCFQSSLGGGAGLSGQYMQGRGGVCDGTNGLVQTSSDPTARFLEVLQYFDMPAGTDETTGDSYWLRVRHHARLQFTEDATTGLFSFANSGSDPNSEAGNGISFQFQGVKQSFASPVGCSGIPPEPEPYGAPEPSPELGQGNGACPFALADSYEEYQDPTNVAFVPGSLRVTAVNRNQWVSPQAAQYADQAPAPLPLAGASVALAWSRRIRRRQVGRRPLQIVAKPL